MNDFENIRNNLKNEDPVLYYRLEIIGKLISMRNLKGISQRELSRLSGVPQKTISRIENGIDYPKLNTLVKLLYPLGMRISIEEDE